MYLKYEEIRGVSLEITSRCNAACPQCPRTGNPILPSAELKLEDVEKIFTKDFSSQLSYVYMCGNFGDAMVSNTTLPTVAHLHRMGVPQVSIHTNGSGRPPDWWRELAKTMDKTRDHVVFGIDGLADTNHIYRRNTNWDTVMESANTFIQAGGRAVWQYLIFEHNQHQVEAARALAKKLGFIQFLPLATSRFAAKEVYAKENEKQQLVPEQIPPVNANSDSSSVSPESDSEPLQLQQQAAAFLAQGKLSEAIAASEKAIEMQPNFPAAYKTLGSALQVAGKVAEAANCYAIALESQPNFPEVYANLGSISAQQQQWLEAIDYYQKAIELKPDFAGAYRNLAKVWEQLGQLEEAQKAWYQAVIIELPKAAGKLAAPAQVKVEENVAIKPVSLEQYQNPEVDNFIKVVESCGGIENYYRHTEISCKTQNNQEIFISFEGELWPCCWVSHTKYATYRNAYMEQMLALIEKYGKGFNSLKMKSIKEVIESPWYREGLVNSWSCSSRLQVCAHECGKSFNPLGSQFI